MVDSRKIGKVPRIFPENNEGTIVSADGQAKGLHSQSAAPLLVHGGVAVLYNMAREIIYAVTVDVPTPIRPGIMKL